MATLQERLADFVVRQSTQDKALKTLINGNLTDLSTLLTTNKASLLAAINELKQALDSVSGSAAGINDTATDTGSTWSSQKVSDSINAAIVALTGGAPAALDTLSELSDALNDDANFAATVTTALGNRVRFDEAQTLTLTQQAQARTNIGAQSAAAIGNPDIDLVALYEAGL